MKRISSRAGLVGVGLCVAALALTGCAGKRPLNRVEEDGDRAFSKGQYDRALADYLEYVERRPGSGEVRHKLALSLLEVKQPALAIEHAWVAFDDEPRNDAYVETLATALFQAGRSEELLKLLRDQVDDRGRVEDYLRLGKYSAMAGDPDGAELAYMTAAKLDRGQSMKPQLELARFYNSIGDRSSAYERLRMALFFDPQNAEVYREIRALGEVPGPSLILVPKELPPEVQARKKAQAQAPAPGGS